MRAIWYDKQGKASEVLTLGEMPEPQPGPGEVSVYIKFSGLNPSDVKQRSGQRGPMTVSRKIPNADGSGVIKAVGPGVDPSRIGQRVWLYTAGGDGRAGSCAEVCVLPSECAVALPDNVSFETGAALGIPAITAHRGVFCQGSISGKTVLVTGGAGAVGSLAIQLCRWAGVDQIITTVSSPDKASIALEMGAHEVIDYTAQNTVDAIGAITNGQGVHQIIDVEFGGNLQTSIRVLRDHGVLAYYGSEGEPNPGFDAYPILFKNIQIQSIFMYSLRSEHYARAVHDITLALGEGALTARIDRIYELEDVAAAHDYVQCGQKTGAVLIRP